MNLFGDLLRWFSGGSDGYMSLSHCMKGDRFWITLTVILDLAVAIGYILIARHWWENEKILPMSQAKLALGNMKRIFIFCGMCGYLFIPIKMIWPAWRLYDCFMVALVFFTWRYALNARQLRVVYHELGRTKQLAYELEESRTQSKRKTFFLNAISHDLRTPLNGLMLQADLADLSASSNDLESLRESLREIKACARTSADLLGSFLELGRLDWSDDPCRESRFVLGDLIKQVVDRARPIAETKKLELRLEISIRLTLQTDRLKLERILQNLVSNAIKFTDRGSVTIEVSSAGRDTTLNVIDTGVGIAVDQHETIFDEFYQVNNCERDSTKGFGLGLAIARRLARQLQGELVVDSEPGRGSRFSLLLKGVIVDGPVSGSSAPAGHGTITRESTTSAPLG
jgi:signal transduction histidine kinase